MRVQVPQEQSRFFDGRKIRVSSSSRKYRAALIFNREEELENFSVVKRVGTNGNSGEQSRVFESKTLLAPSSLSSCIVIRERLTRRLICSLSGFLLN